ncbi:alpha/beta fold hydrolase [Aquabacter spiritensis]|uniref:Pimeloyl-ACP methyl ester carboxylesterase n=1 Tax=Aquabacter spiritensis TaxID=933073 RepID=A0A4R3LLE7_9HYPH|nr:alpha/beta hydrolase [Aquabacter spiritensis]TCT01064.1 pimeloyl-ACP methyl ester carboxylesterase [Aquabacter spiritensis]
MSRYFAYPSADARALFGRIWEPETGGPRRLPVVCLPGLTRSSTDFEALAESLATRGRRVVGFDFRGRGGSAYAPYATYTVPQEAEDTAAGLAALDIDRALFIGTSRGGLVMMQLAATRPELMAGSVLNDIGPVIETAGIARIAGYVGIAPRPDWSALAAELKASQGFLFPNLTAADWERYARQIYQDDAGVPRLAYDSAMADAFKAFDPTKPLPEFWAGFDAMAPQKVLVIHGALSDVLAQQTVEAMADRHRGLEVYTVDDQGHAPLLWDARSQKVIGDFLDRADP